MRLRDALDLPAALDTKEAADLLGCSADLLWKLAREGDAPVEPVRLGRALRWPTARLLELLGLERDTAPGGGTEGGISLAGSQHGGGRRER